MLCLVVNRLPRLLSEAGFFTRAYKDDVIIVINADYQGIASDVMRTAISIVKKWCREVQLTINPENTEAVLFTRKYEASPVIGLKQLKKEIKVSKEAKYLGVVLDSKLIWNRRLE